MLKWNASKIKRLTGTETWLFIIARVLMGFGLGVLAVQLFPGVAGTLGIPALGLAAILFIIAAKAFARPANAPEK